MTLIASTRCGEPPVAPTELADLLPGTRTTALARAVGEAMAVASNSGEVDPALVAHLSGNRISDTLTTLDCW
ncbi:hypothetical protein [Streptomyces sp. NPDC059455]|uniref:hypothetical protein n=1 Tax=Streptomyces sp. NPDC059455 TaxID=3346837 RepID=UPI0036B246BE